MTKQGDRAVEHAEQKAGGEGVTRIERLIDGKALGDHCRLFAARYAGASQLHRLP